MTSRARPRTRLRKVPAIILIEWRTILVPLEVIWYTLLKGSRPICPAGNGRWKMPGRTLIWGIGNEIMGDDAAGLFCAELLRQRNIPWIHVCLCGTLPENYICTIERIHPETLLLLDASDMGLPPGETRLLSLSDIGGTAFSTHGIPADVLLSPYEASVRIRIIGIQPLRNTPGAGISPQVRSAAERAADAVCRRSWGNIPAFQRQNRSPR